MKWQAIAGVTNQINEEAKASVTRKFEKDASVEVPYLWSDFINATHKHLHQSQSNLIVTSDEKTGGLTCLTEFDELHPDFLENKKPFIDYALLKYDQRATSYLTNAKNPLTRKYLTQKIGEYRTQLASQISQTEAKLIDGKRQSLAIESIEKLKNTTYDNPELYGNHLQDSTVAITSLSLLPQEKDKILQDAREELAEAAALGTLMQSPEAVLDSGFKPLWKEHLTLAQRIKLENQANTLLHHKQAMMQQQTRQLAKAHFASILRTGKGISGFDNLLYSSFSHDDPRLHKLKEQESLQKQAFIVAEQLKLSPLSEGEAILKQIAPKSGDHDYDHKEKIHYILVKHYNDQLREAKDDPAKLVEELFSEEIPQAMSLPQRYILRKSLQEQKGIPTYAQKYLMESERAEFLKKIKSKDVNQIKQTIDSIISLQDKNNSGYGLEIMEEILADKNAELLVHFYADNKLYDRKFADSFLEMIPIKDQLFSNDEKAEFAKAVENNYVFKEWSNTLLRSNIQNQTEVNHMRQGIKYLARYYQRQDGLDTKEAISTATEKLIAEVYMDITSKKIQIPRQIIAGNMIHNLNSDYIEANLSELQNGIITGTIHYDYAITFGFRDVDIAGDEYAAARVEEILREGRWKLTPDKKSIYYTFLTKDGSYKPLMAASQQILKFDLLDLDNPQGLERQKQRLLEVMSESPWSY